MTVSPWESEYWWLREAAQRDADERHRAGEEFGIPNPLKVTQQVNEICATRLGDR